MNEKDEVAEIKKVIYNVEHMSEEEAKENFRKLFPNADITKFKFKS